MDDINENEAKIAEVLQEKIKIRAVAEKLSKELTRGAEEELEIADSFNDWLEDRFKYSLVWLDKDDYVKALVRALWLSPVYAGHKRCFVDVRPPF